MQPSDAVIQFARLHCCQTHSKMADNDDEMPLKSVR